MSEWGLQLLCDASGIGHRTCKCGFGFQHAGLVATGVCLSLSSKASLEVRELGRTWPDRTGLSPFHSICNFVFALPSSHPPGG